MIQKLLLFFLTLSTTVAFGQTPVIQWQKSFGGTNQDYPGSILQTTDGGYIIAGFSNSGDGDITSSRGLSDYWVVKISATGVIQWQQTLGGKGDESASDIRQTSDGGYIVAGSSGSDDGDVTSNHGGFNDIWVVKLSGTGSIQWQKTFGGSNSEYVGEIQQTTDGGYIFAGMTASSDGDITSKKGASDVWVVKLSDTGAIQWQQTYGGTARESANSIQQTIDGGYIVAGNTASVDGDVMGSYGIYDDYWVIKLSGTGAIQWQKALGGSQSDVAHAVRQTPDGGYIVAGTSYSANGAVTGNHGGSDSWVIKLSGTGGVQWQKALGGPQDESAYSIELTPDGGYLIAGSSQQVGGNVTVHNGGDDYWVIKLNNTGSIQWQKSLGGSLNEKGVSAQPTSDGGCIIAGTAISTNGDVTGNHGDADYWVVKLQVSPAAVANSGLEEGFCMYPNPVSTEIHIQSAQEFSNLLVSDLSGRVVYKNTMELPSTLAIIPTIRFPDGLYILQVQTRTGVQIAKFQVQH